MLRSVRDLRRCTIHATDGSIGSVHDLYVDDRDWTVRFIVVDTGTWLPGRRVLISPLSVREASPDELRVDLTRGQVEASPDVDTAQPVSRQQELALATYYGLAPYWEGPFRWGAMPYALDPLLPPPAISPSLAPEAVAALREEGYDRVGPEHFEQQERWRESGGGLRSLRETTGYYIAATDGDLGHVEEFLVDDRAWAVRYVVVDTRNWWLGRNVVISPEWIRAADWAESKVHVDLTRAEIERAPEYDPSRPLEREQESRLWAHYQRPTYWEREDRQGRPEPRERDRAA
jgi:hypothetical protein